MGTKLQDEMLRLFKHLITTPLDFSVPGMSISSKKALKGRKRKMERRRRRTKQLLNNVHRGWQTNGDQ